MIPMRMVSAKNGDIECPCQPYSVCHSVRIHFICVTWEHHGARVWGSCEDGSAALSTGISMIRYWIQEMPSSVSQSSGQCIMYNVTDGSRGKHAIPRLKGLNDRVNDTNLREFS